MLTCHGWTFTIFLTTDMKEDMIRTGHKNVQPIHHNRLIKPAGWNNEMLIKCRKWWEAGWEQIAILHLLWNHWKVQCGTARMQNCHWPVVQTECVFSCRSGASGFCFAFHIPRLAVLPIPSPVSHAAFVHCFSLFASSPSPVSTAVISVIETKHGLSSVEYFLYNHSYFLWGLKKKNNNKRKEKIIHPWQEHAACSGLKQTRKRDTSLSCQISFGF